MLKKECDFIEIRKNIDNGDAPKPPPPPPKPPCRKYSGYFNVLLNQDELDQYEEDLRKWRELMEEYKNDT